MIRMFGQFLLWTVICGIFYPMLVYGIGKLSFPNSSSGSLIKSSDTIIGSELLAQKFESPKYFHARPSVSQYDSSAGGASNQGPMSLALEKIVQERRSYWTGRGGSSDIPMELLHASASGLDPHISPEAARYQIPLVVLARGWSSDEIVAVEGILEELTEDAQWGLFGGRKVNVLKLNIRLDSYRVNQSIPK